MATTGKGPDGFGAGHKYLALGMRFAGGVVLFTLGGAALDRWLKITPAGTVIGALVGLILSFLSVYRELIEDERRQRDKSGSGRMG